MCLGLQSAGFVHVSSLQAPVVFQVCQLYNVAMEEQLDHIEEVQECLQHTLEVSRALISLLDQEVLNPVDTAYEEILGMGAASTRADSSLLTRVSAVVVSSPHYKVIRAT